MIDCELELMDGADGEPIESEETSFVTLSTDIPCMECERSIVAGTRHELVVGECDRKHVEWHTCPDCYEIAKGLTEGGRLYGMLWEDLEEFGGEDQQGAFEHFTSGCLLKIETASAKAYLRDRFLKWKGLTQRTFKAEEEPNGTR